MTGSITLLEEIIEAKVHTFVFSSSATVYGEPRATQYREDMPTALISMYGRTKLMVEEILRDSAKANPSLRVACLRYFKPVGAIYQAQLGRTLLGPPIT